MKKTLMIGCIALLTTLSGCYAYAPAPAPVYAAPAPGYYPPPQPAPYYYPAYAAPAVYPTAVIGVGYGGYYGGRCCWRR